MSPQQIKNGIARACALAVKIDAIERKLAALRNQRHELRLEAGRALGYPEGTWIGSHTTTQGNVLTGVQFDLPISSYLTLFPHAVPVVQPFEAREQQPAVTLRYPSETVAGIPASFTVVVAAHTDSAIVDRDSLSRLNNIVATPAAQPA